MSLVNALRFSAKDGAMISDEEFWLHGRRRTFFQDNIHSLLPANIADIAGMELIYAGTGDPYLHYDIINKAKKNLGKQMAGGVAIQGVDSPVYEAAKVVLRCVQEATRLRIEQKLQYLFGFGVDDFNRGYYKKNGNKIQINQECVRKKALNIITWGDKNQGMKSVFESRALIMGHDQEHGMQLFYVNIENQVLSFNSGDYDTVGSGIYGAGHVFANYMIRKNMQQRLQGYPRVEAMVMLIDSAITASKTYKAIGGYFNILYLDGSQPNQRQRLRNIIEERAKLAAEIVAAAKKCLISSGTCHKLIDDLIFQDAPLEEIDELFFKQAHDPEKLELFLRSYKIDLPTLPSDIAAMGDADAEANDITLDTKNSKGKNRKKGGAA